MPWRSSGPSSRPWIFLSRPTKISVGDFTEPELREMVAFCRTDVGRKAAAKLPILMKRGADLDLGAVNEHLSEYSESIR